MICEYCGVEHPQDHIADPHYCIARLQERVERQDARIKELEIANKGYVQSMSKIAGIHRQTLAGKNSKIKALNAEITRLRYIAASVVGERGGTIDSFINMKAWVNEKR